MLIYLIFLAATFAIGVWDGGDITFFVFMLLIGLVIIASEIEERIKRLKRVKKIVFIKSSGK